jgi:hypothetical protein
MQTISSLSFLRRVLAVDALSSGAMGLALIAFAPLLATWLNLPVDLLRQSGSVLLPFAAFVGYLASRDQPSRVAIWAVVALNAVWTIDSVLLLLSGWVAPNALGYAFIIGQALIVGVFAELEYIGLRRASAAATV